MNSIFTEEGNSREFAWRSPKAATSELFYNFAKHPEWDAFEISLSKYVSLLSEGDNSLVAIPVFPARGFRHSSIVVRTDGPIRVAHDLRGARIGLSDWRQSTSVYVRALLQDQFRISAGEIRWFQGGIDQPAGGHSGNIELQTNTRCELVHDRALIQMLACGDLDAIVSSRLASFDSAAPSIFRRLFDNLEAVESEYYNLTGVYPIYHAVVVRAPAVQRFPGIARDLFGALCDAKENSLNDTSRFNAPKLQIERPIYRDVPSPGVDHWPYGIAANTKSLLSFLEMLHRQEITNRCVSLDELFAPSLAAS